MQEAKNNTAASSVAGKTSSIQGGVVDFFSNLFDLQPGWHKRRNIAKNNFELGVQQFRLGNPSDAVFRFKIATWLNPKHAASWYWLGRSYVAEGKLDLAQKALAKAAKLKPNDEHIRYIMAVAKGDKLVDDLRPGRIPPSLIKEFFDLQAPDYNYIVESEGRSEHTQIVEAVKAAVQKGRIDHVVLDLGAGTGLCGSQLRDIASYITGVDISGEMLEQARALKDEKQRGLYDKLINREAMDFLKDVTDQSYDLVLASGVAHYMGDLSALFAEVSRILKPGGMLALSVHAAAKGDYHFDAKREIFTFTKDYLESCAKQHGFKNADVKAIELAPGQGGWLGIFTK